MQETSIIQNFIIMERQLRVETTGSNAQLSMTKISISILQQIGRYTARRYVTNDRFRLEQIALKSITASIYAWTLDPSWTRYHSDHTRSLLVTNKRLICKMRSQANKKIPPAKCIRLLRTPELRWPKRNAATESLIYHYLPSLLNNWVFNQIRDQ